LQAGWHGREALRRFADAIGDPVGDQIVAALPLHLRDRGDRLGAVLSSIAEATAKQVRMRKEADAERASARLSIRFMAGFTGATVAAASSGGARLRPRTTLRGRGARAARPGTFGAQLVGGRAMRRPAPVPRLFRGGDGGRP